MSQKIIEKSSYNEKTKILKAVFNEYDVVKAKLETYIPSASFFMISEAPSVYEYEQRLLHELSRRNDYHNYIKFVDERVARLPEEERTIIKMDFMGQGKKHWWAPYYSPATYYRHKKKAVESLFKLLVS